MMAPQLAIAVAVWLHVPTQLKPLGKALTQDLIAFADSFNGLGWPQRNQWPTNWSNGMDGCRFHGVLCSGDVKGTYVTVTGINLPNTNVTGDISTSKLLSTFAGASYNFAGNNINGSLPNPCDLSHGSPAYSVDFSRNALSAYDGSGLRMVQTLNLSINHIESQVEPVVQQLLANGFFVSALDLSHNLFVGDIIMLGNHHPWERLQTPWLDLSDNCLSGNLTWLSKAWYQKQGFSFFNVSGNYWTDVPTWCSSTLCRPETRSRAVKGCAQLPPSPPPAPAPPKLVVPQQLSACVQFTHYYTDGSSATLAQGMAVDVPGQRQTLLSGACFGGQMQGASTQLQLAKLHKQLEWSGGPSPSSPVSCSITDLNTNVSFFSDTHDYVYKGVDNSRGVPAHHWVTFPGNPFQQRDVWQPANTSSTSGWDMWATHGDFSQPSNRYGQWVYRWKKGVDETKFADPCKHTHAVME